MITTINTFKNVSRFLKIFENAQDLESDELVDILDHTDTYNQFFQKVQQTNKLSKEDKIEMKAWYYKMKGEDQKTETDLDNQYKADKENYLDAIQQDKERKAEDREREQKELDKQKRERDREDRLNKYFLDRKHNSKYITAKNLPGITKNTRVQLEQFDNLYIVKISNDCAIYFCGNDNSFGLIKITTYNFTEDKISNLKLYKTSEDENHLQTFYASESGVPVLISKHTCRSLISKMKDNTRYKL